MIASHLRPEEAGMLRGVLESAGIVASVRDDQMSAINPFLQPLIGGAKLVVRAADEERAREIVDSAGVFPGAPGTPPVEIPEEEWSRPGESQPAPELRPGSRLAPLRRAGPAVALVLLLLMFAMRCASGT